MRKVFGIFALLLALAACNIVETEIQTEEPKVESIGNAEGITITATLAPKNHGTKAVSEGTNTVVATWAENEKIAILYEVSETKYVAEANVDAVDGESGSATISFTVETGTPDNTPCTLVYPASAAKDDHTGVKDAATLLGTQDGTLNASLDVRVGAGTIKTATPGLDVTTQPAPQFAIFKFTTKNADGSATIDVKPLTIIIGAQNFVITPASATSTLYAALPAISSEAVGFSATGSDTKTYEAAYSGISFTAGNFYQSELKLKTPAMGHSLYDSVLGEVVGTDGKAYAVADKGNLPLGVTAAGMVAYKSGKTGLVISLADESSIMQWANARGANGAAAHTPTVTGYSWKLPNLNEWKQMFSAFGGSEGQCTGLNTAIGNAGGTALQNDVNYGDKYWSSTEYETITSNAYYAVLQDSQVSYYYAGKSDFWYHIRSCFVFDPDLNSGVFSVAANQRVQFARGNLTYTSNGWALANNSWEYSTTYYGTTAGSHYFYWSEVFNAANSGDSDIQGGIKSGLGSDSWHALSRAEWRYLLGYEGSSVRTVSWHRYARIFGAEVGSGNKCYLLIFPDFFKETDWTADMGQKPSATAFDGNGHESIAYTESNFAAMQTAGIVILPAAGSYYNSGTPPHWYDVGITGFYWTSNTDESSGYSNNAYFVYFDQYDNPYKVNDSSWSKSGSRYYSVRLVQNK